MEAAGYHPPLKPLDLVYGFSGCHSSFFRLFDQAAREEEVDLLRLVAAVSVQNQKDPDLELIRRTARRLKQQAAV